MLARAAGFDSPLVKKARKITPQEEAEVEDSATSPIQTPEHWMHADYWMRAEKAEKMLELVKRVKPDFQKLQTRPKLMAVLKRKLINNLRVPTASNPSFHLYREVDLMTAQQARSVFFDLVKKGPFLRGKSIYYNFEADMPDTMTKWFCLEERRENGIGQAMMRSHGSVLVMARPPFLIEHQTHDEAEGIKMTAGIMTLNCRGVPRFAQPPSPENDSPEAARERQKLADRDLSVAWSLVKRLAERGTCHLDRHWFLTMAEKFGAEWKSYLTEDCDMDPDTSDFEEVLEVDSEAEAGPAEE